MRSRHASPTGTATVLPTSASTRAGLFGDAWLTCSVMAAGDPADLAARASEWCVQVVEAARS